MGRKDRNSGDDDSQAEDLDASQPFPEDRQPDQRRDDAELRTQHGRDGDTPRGRGRQERCEPKAVDDARGEHETVALARPRQQALACKSVGQRNDSAGPKHDDRPPNPEIGRRLAQGEERDSDGDAGPERSMAEVNLSSPAGSSLRRC
jgi:hypothetical protein